MNMHHQLEKKDEDSAEDVEDTIDPNERSGAIVSLLLSDCDFPRAVLYRSGKERRTRLLLFPFLN